MNLRAFVVLIYVIAFLVSASAIASIPISLWQYIDDWQKAIYILYPLLGFCGILIAYWVYQDEESIRELEEKTEALRKRVEELEISKRKTS